MDVSDPILTLLYLFAEGFALGCLDAADFDDTGNIDVTDAIAALELLFLNGALPPFPGYERCGADLTPDVDELGCDEYPEGTCGAE